MPLVGPAKCVKPLIPYSSRIIKAKRLQKLDILSKAASSLPKECYAAIFVASFMSLIFLFEVLPNSVLSQVKISIERKR